MLHDAAHETLPQRLWQALLVSRHTLASWLRLVLFQVDFVSSGQKPRYVHAVTEDGWLSSGDGFGGG